MSARCVARSNALAADVLASDLEDVVAVKPPCTYGIRLPTVRGRFPPTRRCPSSAGTFPDNRSGAKGGASPNSVTNRQASATTPPMRYGSAASFGCTSRFLNHVSTWDHPEAFPGWRGLLLPFGSPYRSRALLHGLPSIDGCARRVPDDTTGASRSRVNLC